MIQLCHEIDFRSHVPIYVQLVERIKHLIATEVLKPGDQLPTVRQLAADLRVNFNTVARAYRMLDEASVISTQQGRGTFVLERLPPERAEQLRRTALEELVRAFLREAEQMGFGADEVAREYEKIFQEWRESGLLTKEENVEKEPFAGMA
jgi:GntR family transcriptional regulator